MSLLQSRGGFPHVIRDLVTVAGRKFRLPFYTSSLIARNQGAFPLRLYFNEADFTANANYIVLPVASSVLPHGEWGGPVEIDNVWVRGVGGSSDLELVVFQRRG